MPERKSTRRRTPGGATFVVRNPRRTPGDHVILSVGGDRYREGDTFVPPGGQDVDVDHLVETGVIEEVSGDG